MILFLVIFLLILMHISQLDDSFCGCVICKLQNDTFCPGTFAEPLSAVPWSSEPSGCWALVSGLLQSALHDSKSRVNLMIIRNVKIVELILGGHQRVS